MKETMRMVKATFGSMGTLPEQGVDFKDIKFIHHTLSLDTVIKQEGRLLIKSCKRKRKCDSEISSRGILKDLAWAELQTEFVRGKGHCGRI
jgi:hypothetical protein